MAEVVVHELCKRFGRVRALDRVSMRFDDGGLYALLGPSGSGKTTLLRVIAGFESADAGTVSIAAEAVESLPVERRDIGMMFQNYALFPNMSVYDNVAFGLQVRGRGRGEIRRRVAETLALVRLQGLEKRRPAQLSGGQKQRVALARALIVEPRVLLLDEPLSALDKTLRLEMQIELRHIQRDVGITTIFVTHDQQEALSLADRVGVLRDGALVQQGAPRELYERPRSVFVATFLGDANIFTGRREGERLRLADGSLLAHSDDSGWPAAAAPAIAVRPEKIRLQPLGGADSACGDTHDANQGPESLCESLLATVSGHMFAGSSLSYLLDYRGQTLKVFCQNDGSEVRPVGTAVRCRWQRRHAVAVSA